jgi:hypothetical protein
VQAEGVKACVDCLSAHGQGENSEMLGGCGFLSLTPFR